MTAMLTESGIRQVTEVTAQVAGIEIDWTVLGTDTQTKWDIQSVGRTSQKEVLLV